MKTELIIALLGMACIGSLAAFFVAWAKADEWKKTAADEHANYLAALNLHNAMAEAALKMDEEVDGKILTLTGWCDILKQERDAMQDRLSALLCPTSNHVWRDGICVKCGRMKDG